MTFLDMKYLIGSFFILISMNGLSQVDQINLDWANLKKYAKENADLQPPAKGEHRIVFMGNSITESWKVKDEAFFYDRGYIDRGISGQTTPQMLLRFPADVIALKPSVVVILAGINDIAENTGPIPLTDTYRNIIAMVKLARANKIKVVVSSVLPANRFPWRPQIKPAEKVIALNAMLRAYCKTHGIVYLDYYPGMVDYAKGLDKKYTEDGVHPTLAGYKVMEPLVETAIEKALRKRSILKIKSKK